jgi:DNA-binding beta-propeller fold protein YncE/transcriptional regulator with XRE-family HTH domain
MTDEPLTFGALLSRYRTAALLTQEQLAERADLSARGVSDIERGIKGRPRAYTVGQLADALRLSPDDRATFEQAAGAVGVDARPNGAIPEGNFLGAMPACPLVAREEEVERLSVILDTVGDGAGHLLLLGGEMGAGKTRLLQHLMVEARRREMEVLTGRCRSVERAMPFHPVLAALGGLDTRLPTSAREARRNWQKVQQLVSDYTAGRPAGLGVAQQNILKVVGDLLLLLARPHPVAVMLDDLHWADVDTLNLLQHLAHTTRTSPVLLAGSFRDVRLSEDHPELAALLRDLSRERLVERMTVRRLSLEETTELIATTMERQDVSEELASFVYRRTKGNPRLIDQLVRSLGGRLELQGEIGAGSTGRVFRAFDRTLQHVVAAKLVLARTAIELDGLMRFQQEGAVLARLEHPNIVQIHDTFAEEHATCIIMELLDGQSLGQILQDGPLPPARARMVGLQVAEALVYAHGQSIVHRDIKPDNVMVLPGDGVKVMDFGIASIVQPDRSLHTMATTGMRMGTPLYMAPEQIEGKQVDGRTDIYALGAMLYHMVTGRPPFDDSDVLAIVVKQLQEEPVPPSDRDPAIPADWDGVILRALAKDPARRYASAKEMREAIAALSEEAASPTQLVARSQQPTAIRDSAIDPSAAAGRRARTGWIVSASVLGALVLAGGLILRGQWSARREAGPTARLVASWGIPIGPVFTPSGVAIGRHGVVYAADSGRDRVVEFSPAGRVVESWGTSGTRPGQLRDPRGIAVDLQGKVYVADTGNDRIDEFSPAGLFIRSFGRRGTRRGEYRSPQGVAIGYAGTIFVADTENGRVEALTPSGAPVRGWDPTRNQSGQLVGPSSVAAYGDLESRVLVADPAAGKGHVLDPGGTFDFDWPPGLVSPSAVAIDVVGDAYLLDTGLQEIRKYDFSGNFVHSWHGPFGSARALAAGARGAMYVADAGNHRILKLGPTGRVLSTWTVSSKASKAHASPQALARDTDGNLYVAESYGGQVVELSPSGSVLSQWKIRGTAGSLGIPLGVAVGTSGHVYVADENNDRIVRFSPSGTIDLAWGTPGSLAGQFNGPAGVRIDTHGNIYVADTPNSRIEKFTPTGKFLQEWYLQETPPAGVWGAPNGLSIDSRGDIFVTDTHSDTVVELAPSGAAVAKLGGTGSQPGRLQTPEGIAVSSSGTIYVADTGNHRVEIFAPSGKLIETIRKGLDAPADVLVVERHGAASTLYVADSGSGRVLQFSVDS